MQHTRTPTNNEVLDDIEDLLDSIADSSKISVADHVSSYQTQEKQLPPFLPLSFVEKVANSIYSNRSFPSTTPRGASTRREAELSHSVGIQCEKSLSEAGTSFAGSDTTSPYVPSMSVLYQREQIKHDSRGYAQRLHKS